MELIAPFFFMKSRAFNGLNNCERMENNMITSLKGKIETFEKRLGILLKELIFFLQL